MRSHTAPTLLALLVLVSAPLATGQTLVATQLGANVGNRSGEVVTFGRFQQTGFFGACSIQTFRAAGAPGWSSGTGRVELWDQGSVPLPPHVYPPPVLFRPDGPGNPVLDAWRARPEPVGAR